jgi:hypothetical protein
MSHKPNNKLIGKMKELGIDPIDTEQVSKALYEDKFTADEIAQGFNDNLWWYRMVAPETIEVSPEDKKKLEEEFGGDAVKIGDDLFLVDKQDPGRYIKLKAKSPGKPANKPAGKPEDNLDIVDKGAPELHQKYPRLYYTPDQSVLPPTGMEAHLAVQNRFGRLDPVRVGIEDQLQSISDSRRQVADKLQDMPQSQRTAAMATLLSQTQAAETQAATAANRQNTENLMRTEMFNVGQADKENVYSGNNLLNFEQRQLTAKAKTEEELRNYLDFNRKVALNNFRVQQNRNLMADIFPDYDTDFYGMKTLYDPEDKNWQVQDRSRQLRLQSMLGNMQ